MHHLVRSSFTALLAFSAACAAPEGLADPDDPTDGESVARDEAASSLAGHLAQMNDLSVLLPLPRSLEERDARYLRATSSGALGELVPRATYEAAFGPPDGHGVGGAPPPPAFEDLRVVAFRIDPCFPKVGASSAPSNCEDQLRLVFQTTRVDGGRVLANDEGVHAFYRLTRAQLTELVRGVVALRRANRPDATRLGPLGVHPVVADQGMDGAMAVGLSALLTAHAGAARLVRLTQFTSTAFGRAWTFSSAELAGGRATASVIPALPAGSTAVSFFAGRDGELGADVQGAPTFAPRTTAPRRDDMQLLGNVEHALHASVVDRRAALDAAVRIEDPGLHSPNTTDCASCHVAHAARTLVVPKLPPLSAPVGFVADPRWVPAGEAKASDAVRRQMAAHGVTMHVFSWVDDVPSVHQRVVNETAAAVARVNASVLGGAVTPPKGGSR